MAVVREETISGVNRSAGAVEPNTELVVDGTDSLVPRQLAVTRGLLSTACHRVVQRTLTCGGKDNLQSHSRDRARKTWCQIWLENDAEAIQFAWVRIAPPRGTVREINSPPPPPPKPLGTRPVAPGEHRRPGQQLAGGERRHSSRPNVRTVVGTSCALRPLAWWQHRHSRTAVELLPAMLARLAVSCGLHDCFAFSTSDMAAADAATSPPHLPPQSSQSVCTLAPA